METNQLGFKIEIEFVPHLFEKFKPLRNVTEIQLGYGEIWGLESATGKKIIVLKSQIHDEEVKYKIQDIMELHAHPEKEIASSF